MSDSTPHLGLPLLAASQAQKHVTHNEALGLLDALVQLACLDKDLTAPPPSPAEGDRYLVVASNPGGAWAGLAGQVVRYADGVWTGAVPRAGWFAYVVDEADLYIFDGAAWTSFRRTLTAIQSVSRLGINTEADSSNRLAVKADAALLTWDDITPGSGDMRVTVNKKAAGNTLSLLFQTAWSGRAEIGLTGDDDLHLKVSGDGSAWTDALRIDRKTGGVTLSGALAAASAKLAKLVLSGTPDQLVITSRGDYASIAFRDDTSSNKWSFGRDPAGNLFLYDEAGTRNPFIVAANGPLFVNAPINARSASFGGAVALASFTVATLPAGSAGQVVYVSNGRKIGEGSGSGTGVIAYFSTPSWRRLSDDSALAA